MLDIRFIRENAELVEQKSKQKGYDVNIRSLLSSDEIRRDALEKIQALQQQRNNLSGSIQGRQPTHEELEKGRSLKEQIEPWEKVIKKAEKEIAEKNGAVPNVFPDDTPLGGEE